MQMTGEMKPSLKCQLKQRQGRENATRQIWQQKLGLYWWHQFLRELKVPHHARGFSHHLSIWVTVTPFWFKLRWQTPLLLTQDKKFLSEYVLNLKSVWLWCESGDASALCWRPKTELSNAANCLNPQKVFTWASTVCGFLVIQGHRGHAGTFPSALSDK